MDEKQFEIMIGKLDTIVKNLESIKAELRLGFLDLEKKIDDTALVEEDNFGT